MPNQEPAPAGGRVLHFAPGDVRKGRTEALIWMGTCGAYAAHGFRTTLVSLRVTTEDAPPLAAIWEHYGQPETFEVIVVPTTLRKRPSKTHYRLWAFSVSLAYALMTLARQLVRPTRVVVHTRQPISTLPWVYLSRVLPRSRRPQVIIETHALPPQSSRAVVRRVDLALVNSKTLARDLSREFGLPPSRILAVPNSPNVPSVLHPRDEARRELGLSQDEAIACHAGKLIRDEVELMLETAGLVAERVPGFRLIFIGGNPTILRWANERVEALGLSGCVTFAGFVPPAQVHWYLAAADVLLVHIAKSVPTWSHTTPSKCFDYMTAERPIVATDLPLWAEIFGEDGERAIWADHTAPSFADSIARALSLPDGGGAMIARARDWVSGLTWKNRVARVLDALDAQR